MTGQKISKYLAKNQIALHFIGSHKFQFPVVLKSEEALKSNETVSLTQFCLHAGGNYLNLSKKGKKKDSMTWIDISCEAQLA